MSENLELNAIWDTCVSCGAVSTDQNDGTFMDCEGPIVTFNDSEFMSMEGNEEVGWFWDGGIYE